MLCLPGSPALSDFRLEKLQQKIRQQGSEVSDVSATFLHLIDVDENALCEEEGAASPVIFRSVQS
jgi:phosphoribosylformylglycinamidine synthase